MIGTLFSKEKRLYIFTMLGGVILMAMFSVGMMKTSIQPYTTWVETWTFRTSAVVLLIVLMLRGGWKLCKRWPIMAAGAAYLGYAINYLIVHDSEYGADYKKELIWQFVSRLFFIMIVVDVMLVHNVSKINRNNIWYLVIVIAATIFAITSNWYFARFMIFPFLAFYVTPISKKQWHSIMLCLSVGCFIAFSALMIQSIITVPYGESGRYYIGTFVSSGGACHVAMGGFLSALYLFDRALKLQTGKHIKQVAISVSLIMSAFALFFVSFIGNRSMQLAAVAAIIAYSLTYDWGSSEKNTKIRRKIGIILGIVLLLLVLFIVLLINLHVNADHVAALFPGVYLQTKVSFWIERLQMFGNRDSIRGIFPDGSVINIFDHFASERVSIWYETIHKIKLTPIDGFGSAHSIYLQWMVQYGAVSGILLAVSVLSGAVLSCINLVKKKTEFLFPCLCFVSFAAYAGYTASTTLLNVMGFLLLFMQYPLLIHMEEE